MMLGGELWSEAIKAMGSVSGASQKDERPAGAAPIQDLKSDTWLDPHKPNPVRGRISLRSLLCLRRCHMGPTPQAKLNKTNQSNELEAILLHGDSPSGNHCM